MNTVAYEFGIGDYNCDEIADLSDFANWAACMTGPSTAGTAAPHAPAFHSTIDNRHSTIGCEGFDFNADGDIDLLDFAEFSMTIPAQ